MSRRRFRFHVAPPFAPKHEKNFRWRGREVSRLEGLTDAVFAFAVTLLVVALEVPHTFEGLVDVVRSFPAFVICFTLLMIFWTAHYRFFRRYGLEDATTRFLTMAILVLVLFAVYPLKFLFTFVLEALFHLGVAHAPHLESLGQLRFLYLLYGLGFAGVWSLYAGLYRHALAKRHELQLTNGEVNETRASLWRCIIYVAVCLGSVGLAYATNSETLPGFFYCALAPLQILNGRWHTQRGRSQPERQPAELEARG